MNRLIITGTNKNREQYNVDPQVEVSPRMSTEDFARIGRIVVSMLRKDCEVVHVREA